MRDLAKLVVVVAICVLAIAAYQDGDEWRACAKKASEPPQVGPTASECSSALANGKTWIARDGEYREIDANKLPEAEAYRWANVCP